MTIEERKLELIKKVTQVKDENTIEFLEAYFHEKLYRFSQEDLAQRAMKAEENIQAGKYRSQEALERESDSWMLQDYLSL